MLKKIIVCALAALLIIAAVIKLNDIEFVPLINNEGKTYAKAVVTEILKDNLIENGQRIGQQEVVVKILSGEYKGREFEALSSSAYLYGADCKVGLNVLVTISKYEDKYTVNVAGYYRIIPIYAIIAVFFLSIYAIGGKKGLRSCLGLIITFVMIFYVYLPLVYRGFSPFFAAVFSSCITTGATLLLVGSKSRKTFIAIISTTAGVVLAGIFAYIFSLMTNITGYNVSEIDELIFISQNTGLKVRELLFSGILISSLGAVMDVAMSISSACEEIHRQNSKLTPKQLFKSGMNVGTDAMGTMTNTLILAFAGSSVNMIITLYSYNYPYLYTMNLLNICIEIIRGISGSMAIIYTVPITAFLSSIIYVRTD